MALWTPAEITTALWLDAADAGTITELSGAVSHWDDKSGNARHATQGSAASRPVYTASAIGGLYALRFDGSNDHLTHAVIQSNPSLLSVYLVANADSSQDGNLWSHRSEVTRLINLRALSGSGGASCLARGSGGSLRTVSSSKASGTARIYAFEFDRAGTNFEIFIDGESGGFDAYDFGAQTLTSSKNSISGTDSGAGHVVLLKGDIGEVIITEAQHDPIIEGYLAWKWGLQANLPSGHPYEFGAPTTGVTLTVQSLRQGHRIQNTTLAQAHALTPNTVSQGQAVEPTTLTGPAEISPGNLSQGQSIVITNLTQAHQLAINALRQAQAIEASEALGDLPLTVQKVSQGQAAESVELLRRFAIAVNNVSQGQSVEATTADFTALLTPDQIKQAQKVQTSELTAEYTLLVDNLSHSQLLQVLELGGIVIGSLLGEIVIYTLLNGKIEAKPLLTGSVTTIH